MNYMHIHTNIHTHTQTYIHIHRHTPKQLPIKEMHKNQQLMTTEV